MMRWPASDHARRAESAAPWAALAQVAAAHAERLQVNGDEGIVYQFTEHSDRFKGGSVVSVAQGVADAEAHAEVGSESDFHGLDFGFFAWL